MKKAIILLVLVMLTLVGSQAQDLNHSNRVALGYDLELNNYISPDVNVGNGLTLEYVHSFSVSKRLPLYIDFGPKLGWNYIGNVDYRAEGSGYFVDADHYNNYTLRLPVSAAYRIGLPAVSLVPYAGVHLGMMLTHQPNDHDGKAYFSLLAGGQCGLALQKDRWRVSLDYSVSTPASALYHHIGISFGLLF